MSRVGRELAGRQRLVACLLGMRAHPVSPSPPSSFCSWLLYKRSELSFFYRQGSCFRQWPACLQAIYEYVEEQEKKTTVFMKAVGSELVPFQKAGWDNAGGMHELVGEQ